MKNLQHLISLELFSEGAFSKVLHVKQPRTTRSGKSTPKNSEKNFVTKHKKTAVADGEKYAHEIESSECSETTFHVRNQRFLFLDWILP